ncbi:MAG: hypothetical protein HRU75_00315 [Planctomycetia bacterium]|nr:MAG: hypothetical protein HRU75_00315 [Planctomycetia bacterium]
MRVTRFLTAALPALGSVLSAASALAADFPEVEPNDRRADATPATMQCGDRVTGITTGADLFPLIGPGTADYFRIAVPSTPLLIRRYTLTIPPPVHGLSLHGHPVSDLTGDFLLQSATETPDGGRRVTWYGVGFSGLDQISARVTGSAGTPDPYAAALECSTETALFFPAILRAGNIRISTTTGAQVVLFQVPLTSQPGWTGNLLNLTFAPGEFLLGVAATVLYTPGSAQARTGFPDVVVPANAVSAASVRVTLEDSSGVPVTIHVPLGEAPAVGWVRFHVAGGGPGACCIGAGCIANMTADMCAAAGGVFLGGGVSCILDYCPRACCYGDGDCRFITAAACVLSNGEPQELGASCAAAQCPASPGSGCIDPIQVTVPAQLPFTDTRTSCGMSRSLTCASESEDVIYRLTVTAPICLRATVSAPGLTPTLAESTICPPCDGLARGNLDLLVLPPGTHWIAVRPSPCGEYTLLLEDCAPRACCLPNGSCEVLLPQVCTQLAGAPRAVGTTCAPNSCPSARTCCFADGSCQRIAVEPCTSAGGLVLVGEPDCTAGVCADVRGCCLRNGACIVTSPFECLRSLGSVLLPGTPCDGHCAAVCLPGDVNCDGAVNNFDIAPFIAVILEPGSVDPPAGWTSTPQCWQVRGCSADLDLSGSLNGFDVDPFIACVSSLPPPGRSCVPECLAGDMNCDGVVNNLDIDLFVLANIWTSSPTPPAGWRGSFACWNLHRCSGDINRDGTFNGFDRDPFVACMIQPPPPGDACPAP